VRPGQRAVVARGGPGGRGSRRFAGPTHQTPRFAERGLAGEETWVTLQLKLLADVGLVGLPNAGKSSLLARLTRAHPKVADYPFTTLEPALGTLQLDDRQLVLADIPGLIEGASDGAGLGHDFLAHIERTRLLVHVLDLAPLDASQPEDNFATVERELAHHDPRLANLPRIVALSKADLVDGGSAREAQSRWRARLGEQTPVLVTSSASGAGLDELRLELGRRIPAEEPAGPPSSVSSAPFASPPGASSPSSAFSAISPSASPPPSLPPSAAPEEMAEHRVFRPAADRSYRVEAKGPGRFRVEGKGVERIVARYDLDNDDALAHLERRLRGIGVISALEAQGFEAGDEVEIAGVLFDLDPER
jgi:GTPase